MLRALFYFVSRAGVLVYLMTRPQVPLVLKALPVLALAYVIWPRDLILDFPPLIGHLDDAVVAFALTGIFVRLALPYAAGEQRKADDTYTVQADFRVIDDTEADR